MNDDIYPEGTIFIELRGVYDGWSVAKLPDGELINRWIEKDRRYQRTQNYINKYGLKNVKWWKVRIIC